MDRYEPIDRICSLIDSLPDNAWGARAMLHYVCGLLGVPQPPTGLPPSPDRKIGQMFWEYETSELRSRLVDLSNREHIQVEFLVLGILAWMRRFLERQADPAEVNRAIDRNQELIEHLTSQKKLPIGERTSGLADKDINRLLETSQKAIADVDSNAALAQATLDALEESAGELFPRGFWLDYLTSIAQRPPD